jgi:two-component system CheB/CheR fusion protein
VGPFDSPSKSPFSISGPAVALDAKSALALGMALHELCTNAAKYGALSIDEGRVSVVWHIEADGERRNAVLSWRESGGPSVAPPSQKGFGTTMIEKMLAGQIGGMVAVDYAPEGLQCLITLPAASA